MNKTTYDKFLARYPSESTKRTYDWALKQFFRSIYEDGEIKDQIEAYLDKRPKRQVIQTDLDGFFASLASRPPKTLGLIEGTLRAFFKWVNEYDERFKERISEQYWTDLKLRIKGLKSKRARTADEIPTASELRRILSHMPIHGRALFLTLSSGGMRIGDSVEIKLSDLHMNQRLEDGTIFHRVDIIDRKTGDGRFVFISDEAVEAIEEWLRVRGSYLNASSKKCRPRPQYRYRFKGKPRDDDRLFPFTADNGRCIWNLALKKAGLDKRDLRTNRRKFHPHSLRKYYRTKMAGSGIPVDVVESLMGHEAYLVEYRKYSKEDLVRFYLRGTGSLNVFSDNSAIMPRLDKLEKRNEYLMDRLARSERVSKADIRAEVQRDVGGGKARRRDWEPEMIAEQLETGQSLDPLDDLDDDELDRAFIRALRKKVMAEEQS